MKTLKEYVKIHLSQGKHFFSRQEVMSDLGLNALQFQYQAYRLSQKKEIRKLIKDFFMIVPSEYYSFGSLPPHWIIDALMRYLNLDYYIGLLSAASLYGATEQQPMVFQVITIQQVRTIKLPRTSIEFHVSGQCVSALKTTISAPTGYVKISRKEQTIVDLIRYYESCGYLSNVASVIKILAQEIDVDLFRQVVKQEKITTVVQRTGYILEFLKLPELTRIVEQELSERFMEYTLLSPHIHKRARYKKNDRWKVIINEKLELE